MSATPQSMGAATQGPIAPPHKYLRLFSSDGIYLGSTTADRAAHMIGLQRWERVGDSVRVVRPRDGKTECVIRRKSFPEFQCTGFGPSTSESKTNPKNTWGFRGTKGDEDLLPQNSSRGAN
jgi:hypothetical protein